jgi:hypothetical protein
MIVKKKTIFVFFFIFFLINVFLISKRRNFNFDTRFILLAELEMLNQMIYQDNKNFIENTNLNKVPSINNQLKAVLAFLNNNKIREINFNKDFLEENKNNISIEDTLVLYYPIKFNSKSNYIISYLNDGRYNKCKLITPEPSQNKEYNDKSLAIYLCE